MKKLLISLFMCISCIICNAQIYTVREKLDKFDDTVFKRYEKTIITETDSTITFEVKGHTPVTYYRSEVGKLGESEDIFYTGTKDNVTNLLEDVYGYQVDYIYNTYSYKECILKCKELISDINKFNEWLLKQSVIITHRTITTQYTKTYITDLWWIKFNDGSRIIYSKK